MQCKTVDLQVPAHAEIVIEGYCERGVLEPEGPFGDHTGYYTPREPFPVLQVTAMTTRRDPIYPSIVVGVPPAEDVWLGKATERIFLPAVRLTNPEVVDYDLPVAGAFHNCCIVSIRKAFPGHARKVMHAIWGTGLLSLTKCVVVVDDWVDVHDYDPGRLAAGRQRRPGPRRRALQRAARPARSRAEPAEPGRQDRVRRDGEMAGRGLRARLAGGRAHVRRGPRAGRRALGEPRDPAARRRPAAALTRAAIGLPADVLFRTDEPAKPAWLVRSGASLTPGDPAADNAAG